MIGLIWGTLVGVALLLIIGGEQSKPKVALVDLALAAVLSAATLILRVPALSAIAFVALLIGLHQRRAQKRQRMELERSQAWPDAIDFLVSSLRAGMSIGSSLISLTEQGPEILRPLLEPVRQALANDATVHQALSVLKESADDPVADRLVIVLDISHYVGGSALVTVLRSLSSYVRSESRTRSELVSRQSWTVNAAKLAAAAPWIIVVLLAFRAHEAYATAMGSALLIIGGAATLVGYFWMRAASRLPLSERLG